MNSFSDALCGMALEQTPWGEGQLVITCASVHVVMGRSVQQHGSGKNEQFSIFSIGILEW